MSHFQITYTDQKARRGVLQTHHGLIQTPFFMPIATLGAIKGGIEPHELRPLGADIILANTYHLSLRPGEQIVKKSGGLPKFTGWQGPILTDSGGFQVFSLANISKIDDEGVEFHSHIDGQKIFFTPEKAIEIQNDLGSSIAMCFDECTLMTAKRPETERAVERTTLWAKRCQNAHQNKDQLLFGICQGALIPDLCERSTREIVDIGFDGYALGGIANGMSISDETRELINKAIDLRIPFLPEEKPRYLMGLGTPADILDAVAQGVDMFDCVLPTRLARHGVLFTSSRQLKIKNAEFANDFSQIDSECDCPLCRPENNYTRAFLRHLFSVREDLGRRLATLHNLRFYLRLMQEIREVIKSGKFTKYHQEYSQKLSQRPKTKI